MYLGLQCRIMCIHFTDLLKYACIDVSVCIHGILGLGMKLETIKKKTLLVHEIVSICLLFPSLFDLILLHAISILTI